MSDDTFTVTLRAQDGDAENAYYRLQCVLPELLMEETDEDDRNCA